MNIITNNINKMNLTEKTIDTLRDQRLDILRSQLHNICEEFAEIQESINGCYYERDYASLTTIWTRINLNLETYYRDFYKEKLFPLFVPFNRNKFYLSTVAGETQEFYSIDKNFFVRSWNSQKWFVLPIVHGDPTRGVVTVTTPEELTQEDIEVKGYDNPFLAMFAFYCDLVEEVQRVHGELHPRCDAENCRHYMSNGRCRYQDLRKPDPDSCIRGIKGKEVK